VCAEPGSKVLFRKNLRKNIIFYTKLHSNEFECQALQVFEKQALIFQNPAGSGGSPRHTNLLFCKKAKLVLLSFRRKPHSPLLTM
jgi:hypothetical protein